ncbi:transposase [Tepidibacillus sp. HK-1]|uniref:IS110 family transposase n=1 Tax=Tepidibacillus sp. HK-1 TaxID=1883407 RepID=UPI002105DE99|nr:transposase [Tepidibacillus sp. HK-1]
MSQCWLSLYTSEKSFSYYKRHRFSTFTKGLKELSQWLCENDCKDVCMESTGKYWIPVFNVLEDSCNITLAHPKYVKAIRGKKTDKKDAQWIADLFKHDLVAGSFMPPLAIIDRWLVCYAFFYRILLQVIISDFLSQIFFFLFNSTIILLFQ